MNCSLYGLGCTCDPHLTFQQYDKTLVAPSLFAGCIQFQEESQTFIPQCLFESSFVDKYIGIKNWKRVLKVNDITYYDVEENKYFIYFTNMQTRKNINERVSHQREDVCFMNRNFPIFNVHPHDKTPGTNPEYEEYQMQKYKFFFDHRYEFMYLIYLHKSTTFEQLMSFHDFLTQHNYDVSKFIIFNRANVFSYLPFKQIKLPDGNDMFNNVFYSAQQKIMINSIYASNRV